MKALIARLLGQLHANRYAIAAAAAVAGATLLQHTVDQLLTDKIDLERVMLELRKKIDAAERQLADRQTELETAVALDPAEQTL